MIIEMLLDSEEEPEPKKAPVSISQLPEKPKAPYRNPGLGFHFTEAEERAMRRAIRSSIEFMKTFGQAPVQPQIDLSHYITSKPEPPCQTKNTK